MKCGFCGKEIENGAEICPYCGMILNLQDDNSSEPEVNIPDYTPNIFGAGIEKEKENTVAAELPVNDAEESVPVVESIPEYAAQDFNPVEYDLSYQPPEYNPEAEISADESDAAQQEAAEEEAHTAAEQEQVYQDEANEAEADISTEASEEIEDIYSYSSPIEAEEVSENEAQSADVSEIRIPEEDVSYPEYEAFAPVEEAYEDVEDILSAEPEEEEYEEIPVVAVAQDGVSAEEPEDVLSDDDDTYVKSGKMKSGIAAVVALCILLVCLVFAGGYVIKNVFPEKAPSTTQKDETSTSAADETSEEDTTEAETDEEDTTEDITDEETTEADVTEDETTTSETQEVESTTAPSTTKETTTKKPVTTTQRPVTTTKRPVTTTRKPVTTTKAPSTTAPKATEGYGINNVPVKKPAKYLATKYKAYVTANSVRVRASATTDSSLVLHLQKGSEVVVYGSENGFLYVYSTRFGVYGWISKAYLSSSRPTNDSTTVPSGAVSPDKNGSGKIMYTTFTLNLRKGPGTNYGVVKTIPINYPVKVIGYKSGVSGWAYVTDTTTGVNGWVSTAYLK
ncbi:MAG: SH3 domain-containing protein [Acutalibacteraceae bacterium]|nr:SH3 domain-containing protein [Acutalibacteraceae bacterium]